MKAIKSSPELKLVRDIQAFLGFANFTEDIFKTSIEFFFHSH